MVCQSMQQINEKVYTPYCQIFRVSFWTEITTVIVALHLKNRICY